MKGEWKKKLLTYSKNNMEKLPRILKKREADITPKIKEWLKKNIKHDFVYEIKYCKGDTIAEKELLPHQKRSLLACRDGVYNHKIADMGRQNPFDGFQMYMCMAYVIVHFSKYHKTLIIDVADWKGGRHDKITARYEF